MSGRGIDRVDGFAASGNAFRVAIAALMPSRLGALFGRVLGRSRSPSSKPGLVAGLPAQAEPAPLSAVRIERRDLCLANLDSEGMRALIGELNAVADQVGCVVFRSPGTHACVTIIFAGNLERFFMLAAARALRGPVVYVQDTVSWWYQGSECLPDLDTFCRTVLVPEVGEARALLFGQSSGAYAALAASIHLPSATVIACAPQTFSDAATKARIRFVGIRALSAPEGLIDLRERLTRHPDPESMRALVIAAGEVDNPATAHWWGDYLHMVRMVDIRDLSIFVVNANTHVIAHGRVNRFAELLSTLSALAFEAPSTRESALDAFLEAEFGRPLG